MMTKKYLTKIICVVISVLLFMPPPNLLAQTIAKEKDTPEEGMSSQEIEAYLSSPALWGSSSKHVFIPQPKDKPSQQTKEKNLPESSRRKETKDKANPVVQSRLRVLSYGESDRYLGLFSAELPDGLMANPHVRTNILAGKASDLRESLAASLSRVFEFLGSAPSAEEARIANIQELFNSIPMLYVRNPHTGTPGHLLGRVENRLICVFRRRGTDEELTLAREIFTRLGLSPEEVDEAVDKFTAWRQNHRPVEFSASLSRTLSQVSTQNRLPEFQRAEVRVPIATRGGPRRVTRRQFLRGATAAAAGFYIAAQLPIIGSALAETPRKIDFSKLADRTYFQDSLAWLASQNFGRLGNFSYLWKSYKSQPTHPYSKFYAKYGRTWTYDNALGIYAALKTAKVAEISKNETAAKASTENAKRAVTALVNLAKWEEGKGYKGLWHFSYNTTGDDFIDPRGPLGANLWALNAIYSYIIQTGDTTHLAWVNSKMKTFVFGQQVMSKERKMTVVRQGRTQVISEPEQRYGLIRAGLYNAEDYAKGDLMGYGVYTGNPNVQNEGCFVEHNADYIATLRLAAIAERKFNGGKDTKFLSDLKNRHELCVQAILNNFWQKDHFCTAMDAATTKDGVVVSTKLNTSVAVDNNSWLADVIMPYDMEKAWQSIKFNEKRFMIKVRLGGKDMEGLFFFTKEFADPYVRMSAADRAKLEKMLQPEATFGYILLLMRYAQATDNAERRKECLDLISRLYKSMVMLKQHYGGKGTPYATLDIHNYFNTMEAMSSTATGMIVTDAMYGAGIDDFIGVTPPEDFTVGSKAPFTKADVTPTKVRPTQPATAAADVKGPGRRDSFSANDAQNNKVSTHVTVAVKSFSPGTVTLKVDAPDDVRKKCVLVVFKKADVWYIQPDADSTFNIDADGTATVRTHKSDLEKGNTWILMVDPVKFAELRKKLRNPTYFAEWEFDKIADSVIEGVRHDSLGRHDAEMVNGELQRLGLDRGQVTEILSLDENNRMRGDLSKIRVISGAMGVKVGLLLRRALFHEKVHQLLHLSKEVDLADVTSRLRTRLWERFGTIKQLFEAEFGYRFQSDEEFVDELIAKYYTHKFIGSDAEFFQQGPLSDIGEIISENLPEKISKLFDIDYLSEKQQRKLAERLVWREGPAEEANQRQILKLVGLSRNVQLFGRNSIGFTQTDEINAALIRNSLRLQVTGI